MALEQTIENIGGNLRTYEELVPGTFKHADELTNERRTNLKLRNYSFWTADGAVYFMDNGIPTLRITREATNPVLKNIGVAFNKLANTSNYFVSSADFAAVKAASDTVVIDLTQLELQEHITEKEWRYLIIDSSRKISEYNHEQQKLLLRVFGPTVEDYTVNMEMLRLSPQKITEVKFYILSPDYVKANIQKKPIARASWLDGFNFRSGFCAGHRDVNFDFSLRGVCRVSGAKHLPPQPEDEEKAVELTLDEVLACLGNDIPSSVRPAIEERIRNLLHWL